MAQTSLKDRILDYLSEQERPTEIKEIYSEFNEEKKTTIRGRLNENVGKCFKRVAKGVYIAKKGESQAIIIEGDSWEKLKDIEDNSVDTIITDSPYSCLNKHLATGTTRKKSGEWSFKTKDIDRQMMTEVIRILKPNGHFFSFQPSDSKDTLEYNNKFIELCLELGMEFNKRFIWDKAVIGMGYNGRCKYEQILFFSKGKRRKPYNLGIADLLTHKRIHAKDRIHEAEKPIELLQDLLKFSNKKGDVVLDMFAGSLTLAEAGFREGINTISIELDGEIIRTALQKRGIRAEVF